MKKSNLVTIHSAAAVRVVGRLGWWRVKLINPVGGSDLPFEELLSQHVEQDDWLAATGKLSTNPWQGTLEDFISRHSYASSMDHWSRQSNVNSRHELQCDTQLRMRQLTTTNANIDIDPEECHHGGHSDKTKVERLQVWRARAVCESGSVPSQPRSIVTGEQVHVSFSLH
eukprot:6323381-Amphidinium_carterae.6